MFNLGCHISDELKTLEGGGCLNILTGWEEKTHSADEKDSLNHCIHSTPYIKSCCQAKVSS